MENEKPRYNPPDNAKEYIENLCKEIVHFEGQNTDIEQEYGTVKMGMGNLALNASDSLESIISKAPNEEYRSLMREYVEERLKDLRERRDNGENFFEGLPSSRNL